MAVIEVNHQVLREVAQEIDSYCTTQDTQMRIADEQIKAMLASDWTGEDAQAFRLKWDGVDAKDSVTVTFRKSLKSFSEALYASANKYQRAQEDSYTEASRLPRW